MATKSKSAHWQAAFRRRMHEAGLKSVTIWMPKEGADRLARYPEKERGEVITRALALLESQDSPQGQLTGESRGEDEDKLNILVQKACAQVVTELSTRLEQVEATLSAITSNSIGKLTGEAASEAINAQTVEPEEAITLTDVPPPPVAELTDTTLPEPPVKLPLKRIPALIRKAKKLSAQGVSWKEIARRWNAEGIPTHSGIGQWHGSTVAKLSRNE
jgi:hypothetical protein